MVPLRGRRSLLRAARCDRDEDPAPDHGEVKPSGPGNRFSVVSGNRSRGSHVVSDRSDRPSRRDRRVHPPPDPHDHRRADDGHVLGALDQTIVSTAIRTIADDLNGLSVQAWVTTAYLITSTITTPIYGRLGDIYGRKKVHVSISVFIVGSALCSFATSMYMLAAFRAVQGLGAGGLSPRAGDHRRHRVAARAGPLHRLLHGEFGTSSVLGPVIGGFFASHAVTRDDRLALGVPGQRPDRHRRPLRRRAHAPRPHERREARIDWWGAAPSSSPSCPCSRWPSRAASGAGTGPGADGYVVGGLGLVAFTSSGGGWATRQ